MSKQNYAVVKIFGHQFEVTEGAKIKANYLDGAEVGTSIPFSDVMLLNKEGKTKVGAPYIKGARVTAKVEAHGRDDKVLVFKYLRKNKSKKLYGHRQPYTTLSITSIEG